MGAHSEAVQAVRDARVVVYSMGSIFTSIVPSLIPLGMGDAVRSSRRKVMLLNAFNDRETTWLEHTPNGAQRSDFTIVDHVDAIARALHGYDSSSQYRAVDYVTDVICVEGSPIKERRLTGDPVKSAYTT